MISNVPYSLDSFEMYPNVFMIHEKQYYTRSSKNFNINLNYHYINRNEAIITFQGGYFAQIWTIYSF